MSRLTTAFATKLTKVLYGIIALGVALAAWFGINMFIASSAYSEVSRSTVELRKRLAEEQKVIEEANQMPAPNQPSGLASVAVFQSALEQVAKANDCALTEFTTSRTPSPFLSRYSKAAPQGDCSQVEVKLQLTGTARSLIRAIESLTSLEIPFELSTMELTRQATVRRDEALLNSSIELNIVLPPTGGVQ